MFLMRYWRGYHFEHQHPSEDSHTGHICAIKRVRPRLITNIYTHTQNGLFERKKLFSGSFYSLDIASV